MMFPWISTSHYSVVPVAGRIETFFDGRIIMNIAWYEISVAFFSICPFCVMPSCSRSADFVSLISAKSFLETVLGLVFCGFNIGRRSIFTEVSVGRVDEVLQ
jgi:hypothetical protein